MLSSVSTHFTISDHNMILLGDALGEHAVCCRIMPNVFHSTEDPKKPCCP